MSYLSVAKTITETFVGITKFCEPIKERRRKKTLEVSVQQIRKFADDAKRKNLRDRYYPRDRLASQIIPNDQEIDRVLERMEKENLAKPFGGHPDIWEITPFAEGGKWR